MPRHVNDLRNGDPFPVKPDTNEYRALSFLVQHREYGFTPREIAEHTEISESSASKTMARLFEKGLVERADGTYYVEPERADTLQRRLESIDAATRLFEDAPADDAYAEPGWEQHVPSIRDERAEQTERTRSAHDADTTAADPTREAERLVAELTDDETNGRRD